jgi:hypothetical protein
MHCLLIIMKFDLTSGVAATASGAKQAWWYTGLMTCVVLWSALVIGNVGLAEAYTLPPALAAAGIGGWLAGRRRAMLGLAIPGAWLAVAPALLLELIGAEPVLRAIELLALGVMALALGATFDHLRRPLALVALAPAAGVLTLALRMGQVPPTPGGLGILRPLEPYPSLLFGLAGLVGLVAAVGLAAAGGLFAARREARRWWLLAALVLAAVTPACSMRFTWPVVVAMWLTMAAYLALTVLAARPRQRLGRPRAGLAAAGGAPPAWPPFWAIWLVAVGVGIAGWSTRQLRVDVFALPLGLALVAAGLIAKRWLGSAAWSVTPGVAATLGPSTLAVGTDPLTWRAILVLALALGFMIMGALRRWRPPTFVGAGAIAVSLAEVFAHSSSITTVPWLLALVAVGGCLLALAVVFEVRSRSASAAGPAGQTPDPAPARPPRAQSKA